MSDSYLEEDVSHRAPRILVVDDDPDIRGVIREFLEPEGYEVRSAANAREAFGILGFEEVDLVLTDLVMPDREGIEMIQEIRHRFPGVKTVAMSGAKPLNSSLLRLTLQQVLTVSR